MKRCVWLFVIALLTATSFAAGARSEPPRNVLTVEPLALLQGMFNVGTQLRVSDSNAFVFHSGYGSPRALGGAVTLYEAALGIQHYPEELFNGVYFGAGAGYSLFYGHFLLDAHTPETEFLSGDVLAVLVTAGYMGAFDSGLVVDLGGHVAAPIMATYRDAFGWTASFGPMELPLAVELRIGVGARF